MRHLLRTLLLLPTLTSLAPAGLARTESNVLTDLFRDTDLAVHVGTFGALDTEQLFEFGVEARLSPLGRVRRFALRPIFGGSVLDDGGHYWYVGGRAEIALTRERDLTLGLSFAPGIYRKGSWDLGGPVEFRSGIDLSAAVTPGISVGAGLYHLSNGGMYSENGGAESAVFSLAFQL
ncbi:MAG: acyloxyacyl hydrolase [Planctomycetota bacterium]